jgi:predicted transcriptional regulator
MEEKQAETDRSAFVIRLPRDLVKWLDVEAKKRGRSRNYFIAESILQRQKRMQAGRKKTAGKTKAQGKRGGHA